MDQLADVCSASSEVARAIPVLISPVVLGLYTCGESSKRREDEDGWDMRHTSRRMLPLQPSKRIFVTIVLIRLQRCEERNGKCEGDADVAGVQLEGGDV